ncbi:hypothetical protein C2E20_5841 [Micractinium conductrix]|uniref:Uncharacterized protein n=1 Tax=Micractinium conductrix TaxID=554055 RepID=A0A2P6V9D1_9CHLO|nr:hypothetical protein C2E20_5841 [Micractinium conductrix]|eukprot:PSC70693.1 hypothetical protein C2E20_5841 [Micractinium conductrix]
MPPAAPAAADGGHLPAEVAAAAASKHSASTNKRCPCPNCRAAAPPGTGSYSANVRAGGPTAAPPPAGKQQQQQQQKGGGRGAKGNKPAVERRPTPAFNTKALPAKPLMGAAPTGKDVQAAKQQVQPPKPKESIKVKLQKQLARLIKRKKE